ncbi:MAG TPA: hypothetical protein VLA89_10190 [Gemmatimonadales bacterium]|nr:hypothetical protein [Gemmatimonadales bacterium]
MPLKPSGESAEEQLAQRIRQVMPDESPVDLDKHTHNILHVVLLARIRGVRKIVEEWKAEK